MLALETSDKRQWGGACKSGVRTYLFRRFPNCWNTAHRTWSINPYRVAVRWGGGDPGTRQRADSPGRGRSPGQLLAGISSRGGICFQTPPPPSDPIESESPLGFRNGTGPDPSQGSALAGGTGRAPSRSTPRPGPGPPCCCRCGRRLGPAAIEGEADGRRNTGAFVNERGRVCARFVLVKSKSVSGSFQKLITAMTVQTSIPEIHPKKKCVNTIPNHTRTIPYLCGGI